MSIVKKATQTSKHYHHFQHGKDATYHNLSTNGAKTQQPYRRVALHELVDGKLRDGYLEMTWCNGSVDQFLGQVGRLLGGVGFDRADFEPFVPPRLLPRRARVVTLTAKATSAAFRGTFQVLAHNPR